MTDAERKELEEFTHWALVRTLTGQFPEPVFRELGFDDKDIKAIHSHRRERAAGAEGSHFRKLFRKDLHGTLLANLQKVGLLTERMRPALESVGSSACLNGGPRPGALRWGASTGPPMPPSVRSGPAKPGRSSVVRSFSSARIR